jgi:hypothetical protein
LGLPGFQDVVKQVWEKPLQAIDAIRRLHIKLSRTAKALKKWEKTYIGNIKFQLAIAKEALWQLDQAQERRKSVPSRGRIQSKVKRNLFGAANH